MKNEFCKIFGCLEITNKTLLKILRDLEIDIGSLKDENILFYKVLEKVILEYYKANLEIDISKKVYSKEEIVGLLAFLYIRKYKIEYLESLESSSCLSDFFDSLFFSKSSENAIKELKEENEKLKNEEAKKETQLEYHNVDYEVLKKLEKENLELKRVIKYENDVIIKAWYELCEEHIKKNL